MKSVTRWNRHVLPALLLATALVAAAVVSGCSPGPEKSGGPKQSEPQKEATEPAAQPAQEAAKPEEFVPPPEPAAKAVEAMPKPEEPVPPPEPPATPAESPAKSEETVPPPEPPAKPAESPPKLEEPVPPPQPSAPPAESAAKAEAPTGAAAGDLPAVPKVSSFAPAEDLADQVDKYIKAFEQEAENEQEYKDSSENIVKQANALIIIALAMGMSDQESKYKSSAEGLMKAARELADAKDYAAAKKGVEAVKAAAAGQGSGAGELKWEKVAALDQLMKQVPVVNTKLKRSVQPNRFKSKARDSAGYSAVIAAIAQGSIADTIQAKSPDDVQKWYSLCAQMRDAAGAANAAIHAGDQSAADAAMAKLAQSCDDCHTAFHPAALGKTDVEEKEK